MPKVDFNGDGLSDILWRNDAGLITEWLGTGNRSFVSNANANSSVPLNWNVVGIADFNGDGLSDVLWRNEVGIVSSWLSTSNGGFIGGSASEVPLSWTVAGTADFNGDGREDILWRNTESGQLAEWLSQPDGSWVGNSTNVASTVSLAWQVVGTGDFNGDGRDDILWRSSGGLVADWLGTPSGSFTTGSGSSAPIDWVVAGVGDFNADGRDDILWTHYIGAEAWLTQPNGSWVQNELNTGWPANDWVVGIGEYGSSDVGDPGRDDILWRSKYGSISTLIMPEISMPETEFPLPAAIGFDGYAPLNWHVEIYHAGPWG